MNELDLIYLAQPLAAVLATTALLWVYVRRDLLTIEVAGLSFLAYFLAIAGKVAVQSVVSPPPGEFASGLYYGLQTSLLEVGLAYVFARYAIARDRFRVQQAPAYGAGLAFWENGILLGVLTIPGLVGAIATGGTGLPAASASQVVQSVAWGTLERGSSIIFHFSWGILVVVAAASKESKFLAAALPMGFVDFLVPFAPSLPLWAFESIVFALALASLWVTYRMTRDRWPTLWDVRPDRAQRFPPFGREEEARDLGGSR